jgi:hypothetical protein
MQMVASLRRIEYSDIIRTRGVSADRADPNSPYFDPERAAVFHMRAGKVDEGFWLVFLLTHFGKHLTHGWQRLRDVYSGLGGQTWTWARVSARQSSETRKRASRRSGRNGCGGQKLHYVGRTGTFTCCAHGATHAGWR